MYARVARWEGADGEAMRRTAEAISGESGPPEGVPATGFLLLIDPDHARGMGVALFETEDEMRQGDKVLNTMSPPEEGLGRRTAVEMYEVAAEMRA